MTKKSLLSICIFITLLVLSSCVLATNNLGDELKNSWDETKNTFNNIGNNVGGIVSNITQNNDNNKNDANANNSGFNEGTDNDRSTNGTAGVTTTGNTNEDYSATRTGATDTVNGGLNSVTMTWIILAITAAIIVALIWYYGTQNHNETRVRDNNNE